MKTITELKGIGLARRVYFEKRGLGTIEKLLYFFPRAYEDRTKLVPIDELREGMSACVFGTVFTPVRETRIRKNMTIYSMKFADDSGVLNIIWYNNRFVKGKFKTGEEYILYGKVTRRNGALEMANPLFERPDKTKATGRIMPIYPLSETMSQKVMQDTLKNAIAHTECMRESIPQAIREKYYLQNIEYSLKNIHFPKSEEDRLEARDRLAFEELFFLQLALLYKKGNVKKEKREPFCNVECKDTFIKSLPYSLTNAQIRVIEEISQDFQSTTPMMRLCQGDVGSGKTVVAATAMHMAVENGFQSAIMAPTEILANQHYETFMELFKGTGIKIVLLTGSTKKKNEIYEDIKNGEYQIIIGTHAVIQENVEYKNLGLVVADEQHRFGVSQRAALSNKGKNPHFLVMTATPIPRTLALILYGDLDISILDEMPPGRKKVETFLVGEEMHQRVYAFIDKHIKNGSQAYVVCPLIDLSEESDLKNASDMALKLKRIFPDYNIGLIHGRMKAKEKDEIMNSFSKGEIHILVSTTVIEVGVNVPNSNIMVVENAERFGLSQLHQLRGRVGRGCDQAYCILFSKGGTEITKKRLKTMCESNDGFYIAEQDLKLRGPGDFFGTRQHGLPDLKIANLFEDMSILKMAQQAVGDIVKERISVTEEEKRALDERVDEILSEAVIIN